MSEKRVCPGCGRHCSLEEPRCGRGEEYLRTGELPQLGHKKDTCRGSYGGHRHASDINDLLVYDLLDLSHIMRSQYEGKASQKRILIILNESENITQRDLTERLGIQPGSASEILAKLENAGLILRTQNEADRRTIDIYLTDEGKAFAEEALVQRRKRHEDMFSGLSEEEKQQLLSLLDKLCADWKRRYREGGDPHGSHHGHGPHHGQGPHHGHGRHGTRGGD